jgi:hypothetical protein
VGLCVPLSLLGNGSVKTFPRQRRLVAGVVFYAVRVVSKENKLLVLPRSFCFYFHMVSQAISSSQNFLFSLSYGTLSKS